MAGSIIEVGQDSWQSEVLDSKVPVLVDFWAPWCGPCRAIAPTLEQVATELTGKVKVAKVNVDENAPIATQFGIRSIPTLLVFKDGKVADNLGFARTRDQMLEKLAPYSG